MLRTCRHQQRPRCIARLLFTTWSSTVTFTWSSTCRPSLKPGKTVALTSAKRRWAQLFSEKLTKGKCKILDLELRDFRRLPANKQVADYLLEPAQKYFLRQQQIVARDAKQQALLDSSKGKKLSLNLLALRSTRSNSRRRLLPSKSRRRLRPLLLLQSKTRSQEAIASDGFMVSVTTRTARSCMLLG